MYHLQQLQRIIVLRAHFTVQSMKEASYTWNLNTLLRKQSGFVWTNWVSWSWPCIDGGWDAFWKLACIFFGRIWGNWSWYTYAKAAGCSSRWAAAFRPVVMSLSDVSKRTPLQREYRVLCTCALSVPKPIPSKNLLKSGFKNWNSSHLLAYPLEKKLKATLSWCTSVKLFFFLCNHKSLQVF